MLLGQWCAKSIGHEPRIAVEPVAGQAPPLSMLPFSKPGYCRVRRDSMAAPKAEMFFHLNGGSNHPSSVYKVKLPYDAVVCTRDVTRAHLRAPFTLPEAARERGGICQHLPSGTEIDAASLPQQHQPPSSPPPPLPRRQPPSTPSTPSPTPSPQRVTRQLRNNLSGLGDGDERHARRTRAQSRAHRTDPLSKLSNDHDITQAFVEERPPSQPLLKLPTGPASELSAPTSFADADVS